MSDYPIEEYEVLHENSAQDIFIILRELESDRETHERRWPWELLQNAADAAGDYGVDCTFVLSDANLAFTHNGKPFTKKEVAHLILHGSTKTDESEKVRFGTGFIATHLLSRKVHVRGVLDDGSRFDFDLDRTASNWQELESGMYKASKDFRESREKPLELGNGANAEFCYPISEKDRSTAIAGLEAVKANIPVIVALNRKLRSVRIVDGNSGITWTRIEEKVEESDSVRIIPVSGETNGSTMHYSVAIATNGQVSAAILLEGDSPNFEIASMERVPKLYYEFPLATTENFPSPTLIISPSFVPRNERDGLLLGKGEESNANTINKSLLEKGYELVLALAKTASERHWGNLHRLAQIGGEFTKEGLDSEWLNGICLLLISKIQSLELVEGFSTSEAEARYLKPEASTIPYDVDRKTLTTIWDLASHLFPERLPAKSRAQEWAGILALWSKYLGKQMEQMKESLTLTKLADKVSKIGSLSELANKLTPKTTDTITWFNSFLELIVNSGASVIQTLDLVPDQTKLGQFRRTGIYKDPGVSDLLKDVMDLLGDSVRVKLADNRVTKSVLDTLAAYAEDAIVRDAISTLKKKAEVAAEYTLPTYEQANVAFFYWLTKNKKFNYLRDNFPVLSYQKELKETGYISHILADQPLLKPVSLWDEDARRHAAVFPPEKILSESYTSEVLATQQKIDEPSWASLADNGIVFQNLFVADEEQPDEELILNLLSEDKLDEEEGHAASQSVRLSSIAFIDLKDRGINAARKTKTKTLQFLDFFISYAIGRDDSWVKSISIPCSCKNGKGSHMINPSKWLFLLRTREWVYIRKDKEEQPTADNLAPYFQSGSPLLGRLREDLPSKFLHALGISTPELMLASQSPSSKYDINKAFASLLLATNNDPTELEKISWVYQNPTLRSKLDEAYQSQKDIERNQKIGRYVEDAIRELLEKNLPSDKFEVLKVPEKVGGSDIEVDIDAEFDLLDEKLQPQLLSVGVEGNAPLIEVKSTRREFVRVTMRQAKDAIDSPKSHLVCIVEIPENFDSLMHDDAVKVVRENAVFLPNIGPRIAKRFEKARQFQDLEKEIKLAPPDDVMIEVVRGSQVRVRLNRDLWSGGKVPSIKFDQLIGFLKGED